jgi:NAD(P)-dependent dehydrogenase (short-subunit alcohol dehydrogenase family)
LGCEALKLDVSSTDDIQAFKNKVGDQPVDLLLNIAGMLLRLYYRCCKSEHASLYRHLLTCISVMVPHDADTLETVDIAKFQKTFAVNTFGPLLLTQALLPNMLASQHPRIAVVSSRVGSMGDNSSGGAYSYRSSEAAVNALFKSLSVDLKDKNVPVIILHPGIVKTNLDQRWKEEGGSEMQGAVEPEQAASELWKVLMSKVLESTGRFYQRNGEELPW